MARLNMLVQFLILLALLLLNGLFAMAELAVVSSRRIRLKQMAEQGSKGAKAALKLMEEPTRFLSSVQIGITLIGVLAGVYSGANFAGPSKPGWHGVPAVRGVRRDSRLRDRRHGGDLPVADRRRAGAQALGARASRGDRDRACATDADGGAVQRAAGVVVAEVHRPGAAPARHAQERQERRHRGRHPRIDRRGDARGGLPSRRTPHDRGRAETRGSQRPQHHGAARRHPLDRRRGLARDRLEGGARQRTFALPGLPGRNRRAGRRHLGDRTARVGARHDGAGPGEAGRGPAGHPGDHHGPAAAGAVPRGRRPPGRGRGRARLDRGHRHVDRRSSGHRGRAARLRRSPTCPRPSGGRTTPG